MDKYTLAFPWFAFYYYLMGYSGKLQEKLLAQNLRSQGYSYGQILQKIPVSKDTISKWCRDIHLSPLQKEKLLQNKKLGQKKGSLVAAENKRQERLNEIQILHNEARNFIGSLSEREMFLVGVALYAGEGTKMDKHVAFSNADPKLILFMTDWFRIFTKVSEERLRGRIWLHDGLDEEKAKNFWSVLTHISEDQFIKTYITKQAVGKTSTKKNIHEYGVFSVSFSDARIHRKIMGWISGLFDDKMSIHSAIAQR